MKCKVIWIDDDPNSKEKLNFAEKINSLGSYTLKKYINVDSAIEFMKGIEFEETKIIISDKLYFDFVKKFKENILNMRIAPKIIIFSKNKQIFVSNNRNYLNNGFYNSGGVVDSFQEIDKFLDGKKELRKITNADDVELTFEYIDSKQKLILPLFFKTLIENISNKDMDQYTSFLYKEFFENDQNDKNNKNDKNDKKDKDDKNKNVKNLLSSIQNISDIPIEILSKYYARLYSAESEFYKNINKDLRANKFDKYLKFIKILYEGVKLKSLPLANNNTLYRGAKISNDEIKKIMNYKYYKKQDLPSSIVFSRTFLSFSKDKIIADRFLSSENKDKNLSKVLFILEKDDNIGYNLSTHGDIEKISFIPDEREVLFFPFSSFEVKDIKEINIGNERGYEIKLLYLGKYLKEIEKDSSIISKENPLPNTEFKKQLCEAGLIKQEKVENVSAKSLYQNFKDYEKGINIKNRNFIIGEIYIKPNDINKDIRIINTFENYKRQIGIVNKMDDWKYENEYEIVTNTEIKINGIINKFSYFYKFPRAGKYIIQYSFKNYLTKTNHMFWGCNLLTFLNLSNFNTKNVTNMCAMFGGCNSLTNLNLFNLNTQNVTNMSRMFLCCYLLKDLDLSSFNIQNVINMNQMFLCCYSLTSLNLLNFNTQNVIYMNNMFDGCNLLNRYNIIARDNKILSIFDIKKSGQFNITNSFFK